MDKADQVLGAESSLITHGTAARVSSWCNQGFVMQETSGPSR